MEQISWFYWDIRHEKTPFLTCHCDLEVSREVLCKVSSWKFSNNKASLGLKIFEHGFLSFRH